MNNKKKLDEMDELLLEYFKNKKITEDIVPPSTKKMARNFINRVKFQNTVKKFNKVAAIFITIGIMTTGIVFAKDIANFVKSLFTNSTPAIDTAVENGYVQNVDMDYVYCNDIGVKVEYLLVDDLNLDISFAYKVNDNDIKQIKVNNYVITSDNDSLIYSSNNEIKDKIPIANYIIRTNPSKQVENRKHIESILFNLIENREDFNKLYFKLNSFKIIKKDDTILDITGNWNFEIELDDNMKNSSNVLYEINNKENIEHYSAIMTITGFIVEIKLNFPIELERLKQISNFILENNAEEKFEPYLVECSNDETLKIYYNNISKYSNNIDKLILYLKVSEDKIFNLKLNKID